MILPQQLLHEDPDESNSSLIAKNKPAIPSIVHEGPKLNKNDNLQEKPVLPPIIDVPNIGPAVPRVDPPNESNIDNVKPEQGAKYPPVINSSDANPIVATNGSTGPRSTVHSKFPVAPPEDSLDAIKLKSKMAEEEANLIQKRPILAVLNASQAVFNFPFSLPVSAEAVASILENSLTYRGLEEGVNRTRAYLLKNQPDFDVNSAACQCGRISEPCVCCVAITKTHVLSGEACMNLTYIPARKAVRLRMSHAKVLMVDQLVSLDKPPQICVGGGPSLNNSLNTGKTGISKSQPLPVFLCADMRHLSYSVQLTEAHKTMFSGCVDWTVRLQTRDIAIYPLGCFRAPPEVDKKEDDKHHAKVMADVFP